MCALRASCKFVPLMNIELNVRFLFQLYTVVRSVKSMQTTLEDGESQMFSEDMQYMLEGLGGPGVSLSTRCLSLLSMATKATQSNFRVHFRAQLILPRICILMKDAPVHPALALATSLLLYVLSRDKIPLHLDIYALALVIRLIKNEETADWTSNRVNATNSDKEKSEKNELFKVKTKLKKVLISLPDSASKLLCLSEEVSPSALSLEVLLSVYCEKSKWTDGFKTQIMKSGAIEYVGKACKPCFPFKCYCMNQFLYCHKERNGDFLMLCGFYSGKVSKFD